MSARPPADGYYGAPVLKQPVWGAEIAVYLFAGGLAGASAPLAFAAGRGGNRALERAAWSGALAGIAISPVMLTADLGRPERFLNMLRVVKPTSPMSVGTWILSASGAAIPVAAANALLGAFPRLARAARPTAALLGPALSTYTAVLLADTAVPAWHDARRELPFTFAGSATASAAAWATALTPPRDAGPARRLLFLGSALELASARRLERRGGESAEPFRTGEGHRFLRAGEALTAAGATLTAAGARRRPLAVAGGALVLAGSMAARWGVFRAGFQSAADPRYTLAPQRARVERGPAEARAL